MDSRQAKRARLREWKADAERSLARGLPRQASTADLLPIVHVLVTRLEAARSLETAADLAAIVHRLFEQSLRRHPPGVALACRKGCNWCCYATVSVSVPEALLLATSARTILSLPETQAVLQTTAARPAGNRVGQRIPCALLAPDGCQAYPQRPTMCRVANSLDVNRCIEEYEGRALDQDVPVAVAPLDHGGNARTVLLASLLRLGLDAATYDLAGALAEASDPDAVARRWLAGEPAFVAAARLPVDARVSALANALAREHRQLTE